MPDSEAESSRLEADMALLTGKLDGAIHEVSGQPALELVRELRAAAVALRAGQLPAAARAFRTPDRRARLEQLGYVARAFTQWFHLINAAEEQHRMRLLRRRDDGSIRRRPGLARCRRCCRRGVTAGRGHARFFGARS